MMSVSSNKSSMPVRPVRRQLTQAIALSLVLGQAGVQAGSLTVTSSGDAGPGSLREAVALANNQPGPDEIGFVDDLGTILLTSGQIEITETLTIAGPPGTQEISGNENSRIFAVTADNQDLTLANLRLINGRTTTTGDSNCSTDGGGGAVCAQGSLTLMDSLISDSATLGDFTSGGGLFVRGAELHVINSTIKNNYTLGGFSSGGGVSTESDELHIIGSNISNNHTIGQWSRGGGVFADETDVILSDSVVSGNSTEGNNALGGGLYQYYGDLTLSNCLIDGNSTSGEDSNGGGALLYSGGLIINCQITNNFTTGVEAEGGALAARNPLTIRDSVISHNQTINDSAKGGALAVEDDLTLDNTVVFNNQTAGYNAHGGGVAVRYAQLTLLDSSLIDNQTTGDGARGGGVHVEGYINAQSSQILGNQTSGEGADGGGMYIGSSAEFIDTVIAGNSTAGEHASGGGMRVDGTIRLVRSTVAGNATEGSLSFGGGLHGNQRLEIINSTISGNAVDALDASGGGIYLKATQGGTYAQTSGPPEPAGLYIDNSTIVNNRAPGGAGGLFVQVRNGELPVQLGSTILADNEGPDGNLFIFEDGGIAEVSAAFSLFGDDPAEVNGSNSNTIFSDAPDLLELADNGCAATAGANGHKACVPTHAMTSGSPAFNSGSNPLNLTSDQRGSEFARTAEGQTDIGAFEFMADTLFSDRFEH